MSLGSLKKRARSPIVAEINITPLTDIFLVLLIIFMVTSAAMVQSGASINLPEVDSTAAKPKELTITVTPENDIYVNAALTPYEELEPLLRGFITNKPDIPRPGDRESSSAMREDPVDRAKAGAPRSRSPLGPGG
jgi:biopolymer transport protein ExbD